MHLLHFQELPKLYGTEAIVAIVFFTFKTASYFYNFWIIDLFCNYERV